MTEPTEPAVLTRELRWEAQGRHPVDGIDLAVAPGEIFGIVGADGAGKSTLLRLLTGQIAPSAGSVQVLGRPAGDPSVRERIAYMPQSFGQYPDLSVQENLRFYAALHGLRGTAAATLVADLTARAGLRGFEDRRAGQLSGGMMQKLALACALVTHPRAMFLDEPTTGVDPVSRRAFWQLLEGVRAEGVAIVCATANMQEAERCDRMAVMDQGRFVHVGRATELIAAVRSRLYATAGDDARALVPQLRQRPEVELAFPVGRQARVWLRPDADPAPLEQALASSGHPLKLTPVVAGLHDVTLRELALQQRETAHA
jgi:ABC-2 type transport system ATP-binding protein